MPSGLRAGQEGSGRARRGRRDCIMASPGRTSALGVTCNSYVNLSPLNGYVNLSPWDYDQGDDHLDPEGATAHAGVDAGPAAGTRCRGGGSPSGPDPP